jgi:hypothetical protein
MSAGPITYLLHCLRANVGAGIRLASGLKVRLLDFRVSVAQLVGLNLVLWLIALADDALSAGPEGEFNIFGLVQQAFFSLLFVLLAGAFARAYRRRELALALPVLLAAGEIPIDLCLLLFTASDAVGVLPEMLLVMRWWIFLLWFAFMAGRSLAVALGPSAPRRFPRALAAAALFTGLIVVGLDVVPPQRNFVDADTFRARDDGEAKVTSEAVWSEQPQLLDAALAQLEDGRPGVTDLYFVGFAPYAAEDVFRKDVTVARDVFDQRFDTKGRSVLLISNRRTLLETPIATVSNLRATLQEIGQAMNPGEDVVVVYLASHGSPSHELVVEFGPLELEQLTPTALHRMFQESGIKWKIVIVSACYSGGFIEPLKDDYTIVITASQADRTSFGCGNGSDSTYFGDAYFNQALRKEDSLTEAFRRAKLLVEERERKEGVRPPSNPQIFVGPAIAEKMKGFEQELGIRRGGPPG